MKEEPVVTMPVIVSEGKTRASDGMEMTFGKIGRGRATQGTIGFKPRGSRLGAKIEGDFCLKQGNVATLDINVATFQRMLIINVTTLDSHIATFQRRLKLTSRRWILTSRRSRGG